VDYVEIDKYAVKSYNAIYNENFEAQDICEWDKDIEVDLIFHGSPCQDFSLAGKGAGGDEGSGTRSSLMYETIRIVEKLKPKYVIWENVKNVISKKHIHNFNNYITRLNELGYTSYYQVLNAKDYGIPQNRERVFVISILGEHKPYTFPPKQELKLRLKDMLEDEVDEKYYLSDKMIKYISATGTANFRNPDCKINLDIARPITTVPNKRAGTTNYLSDDLPDNYDLNENKISNGLRIRKLTPREAFRLMGFDDEDFNKAAQVNSNTQLYKQAGNSIVVNVLEAIFKELFRVGE
jgi:DNA (cytosine-5)-methyltransferase 1